MEADWEVEIGGEAPVIDACWEGLVDLRRAPELAAQLSESRQLPALAPALVQLNSELSPVQTSKCDVWSPGDFDPDELDAHEREGKCALACYIDLLPQADRRWPSADHAIAPCRAICARLHRVLLRCCRADLIVRQARIASGSYDLAITAYLTACGPTPDSARATLESALAAFVSAMLLSDDPATVASKLQ